MRCVVDDRELEEIRFRCLSAKKGPWISYVEGRDHTSGSNFIMTGAGDCRDGDLEILGATAEDQDFIAHARQDVPRLLDEVLRLRAIINIFNR